jgi:transcriptional regulator with XRE-family HTH domain
MPPAGRPPRSREPSAAVSNAERDWQRRLFGRRLQAGREAAGLNYVSLARLTGLSPPTVAAYERGTREPRLSSVRVLATALGMDAATLAFGAPSLSVVHGAAFSFGSALQSRRVSLGLNTTQLAERVGVSRTTIDAYEAGAPEPDLTTLRSLARALDVEPATLAFGGGPAAAPHARP